MDLSGFANGLMMIFAAIYLAAVLVQGNFVAFLTQLSTEIGYVEWLVALLLLYWLYSNPATSWLAAPLIGIAVLAVLLRFSPQLNDALANFATGKSDLFATFGQLTGAKT